ncbi:hypothetical protein FOA52_013014 [Chlamydomonas sp. UWO 241]|nr:hypothetical protein FOA52_013014 [Chlamydomonas sp. UWO 241]
MSDRIMTGGPIEKLDSHNWGTFKPNFRSVLRAKNMSYTIKEDGVAPVPADNAKNQEVALGLFHLREFYQMRMSTHKSMGSFYSRIVTKRTELRDADEHMSNAAVLSVLMMGVPEEYRPISCAAERSLTVTVKVNHDPSVSAHYSSALRNDQRGSGVRGNCNYCNQPGHWEVDCPKKHQLRHMDACSSGGGSGGRGGGGSGGGGYNYDSGGGGYGAPRSGGNGGYGAPRSGSGGGNQPFGGNHGSGGDYGALDSCGDYHNHGGGSPPRRYSDYPRRFSLKSSGQPHSFGAHASYAAPQLYSFFTEGTRAPDNPGASDVVVARMAATPTPRLPSGAAMGSMGVFNTFNPSAPPRTVFIGNGMTMFSAGEGSVLLESKIPGDTIKLQRVLYMPDAKRNLFSISQAERRGARIVIEGGRCQIITDGKVHLEGKSWNGLYSIDSDVLARVPATSVTDTAVSDGTAGGGDGGVSAISKLSPVTRPCTLVDYADGIEDDYRAHTPDEEIRVSIKAPPARSPDSVDISGLFPDESASASAPPYLPAIPPAVASDAGSDNGELPILLKPPSGGSVSARPISIYNADYASELPIPLKPPRGGSLSSRFISVYPNLPPLVSNNDGEDDDTEGGNFHEGYINASDVYPLPDFPLPVGALPPDSMPVGALPPHRGISVHAKLSGFYDAGSSGD